jgi:hypothetical protein
MKSSRHILPLVALLLLCSGISASAQTVVPSDAKLFSTDGLGFNYPAGWSFNDTSDKDAQKMAFGRADSEAQITVFVFRTPVISPERIVEAKKVLVDKYVASTKKQFEGIDPNTQSSPATSTIGTVASEGVRIRASLDGVPGSAEIQWAVVGQRLVVLTFLGPDKALTKATPTWDLIRTTLKVEEPQPKTPQPAASPKP